MSKGSKKRPVNRDYCSKEQEENNWGEALPKPVLPVCPDCGQTCKSGKLTFDNGKEVRTYKCSCGKEVKQ